MIRQVNDARKSTFLSNGTDSYANTYGLQPADRIKEPIFQTALSKHHAIYLGMDQFGQEWIAENHWQNGVRLTRAADFFKKGNSYSIIPFEGTNPERINTVKRALAVIGKPYDLIQYNCEHYASYVQYGKPESKQVWNVLFFALATLFIGIALSKGGRND